MEELLIKETLDVKPKTNEYKNITREEMRNQFIDVYGYATYYFCLWEDEFESEKSKFSLPNSLIPFSGLNIYFDLNEKDDGYYGEPPEFRKMRKSCDFYELVIFRRLADLFSLLNYRALEFLMELRNFEAKLFTIDYENNNFIEIDIKLLLMHLLEETSLSTENFCDEFSKISQKYYDGKI